MEAQKKNKLQRRPASLRINRSKVVQLYFYELFKIMHQFQARLGGTRVFCELKISSNNSKIQEFTTKGSISLSSLSSWYKQIRSTLKARKAAGSWDLSFSFYPEIVSSSTRAFFKPLRGRVIASRPKARNCVLRWPVVVFFKLFRFLFERG